MSLSFVEEHTPPVVPVEAGMRFYIIEVNDGYLDCERSLQGISLEDTGPMGGNGMVLIPKRPVGALDTEVVVKCQKIDGGRDDDGWYEEPICSVEALREDEGGLWGRFYREYGAMVAVGCDFAPRAYAFGYVRRTMRRGGSEYSPAIAMERLGDEWMSLWETVNYSMHGLDDIGRIRAAAHVGILLAKAVGHLRESGYLHHDISEGNVFLKCIESPRGDVVVSDLRLIDFGNFIGVDETATPARWGTNAYAAPEMVRHNNTADLEEGTKERLREDKNSAGSDVWSIGAALYYIRTGNKPPVSCDPNGEVDVAETILFKLSGLSLSDGFGGGAPSEPQAKLNEVIAGCTTGWAESRLSPDGIVRGLEDVLRVCDRVAESRASGRRASNLGEVAPGGQRREFPRYTPPLDVQGNSVETGVSPESFFMEVYGAVYQVQNVDESNRPRILVLGSSKRGCSASTIVLDGEKHPLVLDSDIVQIPTGGWEDDACPWRDIEAAYVKERIKPRSMRGWFCGCDKLRTVRGLESIDTSLVTDMQSLFSGCSSLASLDVSGWDTSSVTSMRRLFEGCSALVSLNLSGWDTSSVTNMNLLFSGCFSLASLDVSGWDTSSATEMILLFGGCCSLASLDVSGWDTSSATLICGLFFMCSSLASLDVSGWDTSSVTNMNQLFSGCSSLASLDVSGWDTSSVTSMCRLFEGCSALVSLNLSGWDTSSVTDMRELFEGCSLLEEVYAVGWDCPSREKLRVLLGANA